MPLLQSAARSSARCTQTPQRAAQLGRKGSKGNRHVYETDPREVAAPQTASDAKNLLAEVMADIRAGKMGPKLGTTLGYLRHGASAEGSSLLQLGYLLGATESTSREVRNSRHKTPDTHLTLTYSHVGH